MVVRSIRDGVSMGVTGKISLEVIPGFSRVSKVRHLGSRSFFVGMPESRGKRIVIVEP